MTETQLIEQCRLAWNGEFLNGVPNKNNCSGFVKAVARAAGVPLPQGDADQIVDGVKLGWTKLLTGESAAARATSGSFVLAALKGSEHAPTRVHGHVAIVVGGALYRDKYPLVWCGSTGSAQSQGTKSVGEVWNRTDRDKVAYFEWVAA